MAAVPSLGVVQHFSFNIADAEARLRGIREDHIRNAKFLEEEWLASERRRSHSEHVAAMRNFMVGGQLADAHDKIQRLGSERPAGGNARAV